MLSAEQKERAVYKISTLYQGLFAFLDENVSMLSYVVKVYYYMLVLSTHYKQAREASNKYKAAAIWDYNENKSDFI